MPDNDDCQPDPEEIAFDEMARQYPILKEIKPEYFSLRDDLHAFYATSEPCDPSDSRTMSDVEHALNYAKENIKRIDEILNRYKVLSEPEGKVRNYFRPMKREYRVACCEHFYSYIKYEFCPRISSFLNDISIMLTALPLDLEKEHVIYCSTLEKAAAITNEFNRLWAMSSDIQTDDEYYGFWLDIKNLPTKALENVRDGLLSQLGLKVSQLRQEYFMHNDYVSSRMNRSLLIITTIFAVIAGMISLLQLFITPAVEIKTAEPIKIQQELGQ
ncbi:MAG: hypothetical protein ABIG34_01980 [Candidatus Peregrinibacteria bacterium]